jgi:hypothetical protein
MGWFSGLYRKIIVGSWNSPQAARLHPVQGHRMPTCLDDRRQETAEELEFMRRWRGAAEESENRVPRRWRVRIVAGRGLRWWTGGGGLGGRCTVVLARRPPSPTAYGPFEAVNQIVAGAPCRVTPVAAACACVSLLY